MGTTSEPNVNIEGRGCKKSPLEYISFVSVASASVLGFRVCPGGLKHRTTQALAAQQAPGRLLVRELLLSVLAHAVPHKQATTERRALKSSFAPGEIPYLP